MFTLHNLLTFEDIVIQCHDYPDADTLAAAFALYSYLSEKGKSVKIIYSGRAEITKPNLVKMIGLLAISIEYVQTMPLLETLIVVDGQYGEGNVTRFAAKNIFQIDHHVDKNNGYDGIVNSHLGSCSTLMWDLLNKEKFNFNAHSRVSTALYYGLYTDTSGFEEIAHPLDKDLRDETFFSHEIFNALRFNNFTIDELRIAGLALTQYKIDKDNNFAIFRSEECDPNVLGFISDLALQVDGVDICVVYNTLPSGYKLSIRSCTREVMASDIAHFLSGGGGHQQKAGGFIPKLEKPSINEHLSKLSKVYSNSYNTIDASSHDLNISSMPKYVKRKIPIGHVLSTDVFAAGTPMLIRTLEGDSDVFASENILLMIGPEGEVYPIDSEKFLRSYTLTDIGFIRDFAYSPTAKNKITGVSIPLISYAKPCIPTGQSFIHAAPISKRTKVFTKWNPESYMLGEPGDYIAVRADDYNDVYIIKRKIFYDTYEQI